MINFTKNGLTVLIAALTLTACGGGGGSGSPDSAPTDGNPTSEFTPFSTDHLKVINADYARNRSIEGAGVTVAIFDSGVNMNHAEFADKTLNPNSGSYEAGIGYYTLDELEALGLSGIDAYQPVATGKQEDTDGHGTHVSSMVWGENVGVAPDADVIMMDIQTGSIPDTLATKALISDLSVMGADFINASMSGVEYYVNSDFINERPLYEALEAGSMGLIVAGGNEAVDMTEAFITNPVNCLDLSDSEIDNNPVCDAVFDATVADLLVKDADLADNVLWVGAVDNNGVPAQFADGGTNVPGTDADIQARWISAPGFLVSTPQYQNDTGYTQVSGTSFAAPLVTGAAALVKGQFPTLTNTAVLQILLDTANSSFDAYDPAVYGQGILDIEAALKVNSDDYSSN